MELKHSQLADKAADVINDLFHRYADSCEYDCSLVLYSSVSPDELVSPFIRMDNNFALTDLSYMVDGDNPDDNHIVRAVSGEIYISKEGIYEYLIDCNLDIPIASELFDITIAHEVGHIISANKLFTGMSIEQVRQVHKDWKAARNTLQETKKDASIEERVQYIKDYFNLPAERAANESVGLTTDRIINAFRGMWDTMARQDKRNDSVQFTVGDHVYLIKTEQELRYHSGCFRPETTDIPIERTIISINITRDGVKYQLSGCGVHIDESDIGKIAYTNYEDAAEAIRNRYDK